MSVDWNKVQTNVVSVIVVAIVAGAFAIVWRGATTVDDKIDASTAYMREAVDVLQGEVLELRQHNNDLIEKNNELIEIINEELRKNRKDIEIPSLKPKEIPEENYIQHQLEERLPEIDFRQMAPRAFSRR